MAKTKQLLEQLQYPDWLLDAEYQEWLEYCERPFTDESTPE